MTGWNAFSQLLCDTSSINKTHCSNQTLRSLISARSVSILQGSNVNEDLATLLYINGLSDSLHQAAAIKILLSHPDLSMQPLFEWYLKVMPYVLDWLEEACVYAERLHASSRMRILRVWLFTYPRLEVLGQHCQQDLSKRTLSALYQFIKSMPEL